MARYPDFRSAAIPALHAAQRLHGWCSPTAIEQVACVMRLTPGYLTAVATFYDMFETTPKGRVDVYVCTNISCSLRGADAVYAAMLDAAGNDPEFHVKSFECLGACDIAPMASDRRRVRRAARGVRLRADRRGRQGRPAGAGGQAAAQPQGGGDMRCCCSTTNIDQPGLNTLDVYRRERGGYEMLSKALDMEPADVLAQLQASGLRGRGGAGFAMGTKASFIPKGDMDKYVVCNADESEPGTFKDRELMQKNPHLLIEGICIAAHAVGANKAFIFIRGEYALPGRHPRGGARRRRRRRTLIGDARPLGPPRRRRLHLRRGDRAARRARGQARQPAPEAAVPGGAGPLPRADADQQRRDADERPDHPADGRRGVREDRHRALDRHQGRLRLGLRAAPGQLRDRARHPVARADLRPRRRAADEGRSIKFWFPGGSSAPVLPGTDEYLDLPYDFESMAKAGLDARLGRDHRRRRLDPGRRRRAQDGEVLPPRVVRQVHAVPRGHQLDREDARADRLGRGDPDGPRHHGLGPGADHRQLPVRARRRDGDADRLDDQALPRRVRGAHRGRARAQRARRRRADRSTATTTRARPTCSSRPARAPGPRCTDAAARGQLRHVHDRRARGLARRRTRCSSTPPSTATSRSPSSATSPSSASRSARAACAWSRSRASRSCRPAAPRRSRTAWSSTRRPSACTSRSARSSSSC